MTVDRTRIGSIAISASLALFVSACGSSGEGGTGSDQDGGA